MGCFAKDEMNGSTPLCREFVSLPVPQWMPVKRADEIPDEYIPAD
jgi:hypothetical protein